VAFLRLRNASVSYSEGREVLHDISLDIEEGEFVLITGPTGSGKSTLGLCLAGLLPEVVYGQIAGHIELMGVDPRVEGARAALRASVGMVFQTAESQLIAFTLEEEVAFGPENLGLSHEQVVHRTDEAIAQTGLPHLRGRRTSRFSGGEKQRTVIGAALAMEPRLMVLDEPLSNLDPQGAHNVAHCIKRMNEERGVTVVLIEKDLDLVGPLCDRLIVIDGGRIVADGPPEEVLIDGAMLERSALKQPEVVWLAMEMRRRGWLPAGRLPLSAQQLTEGMGKSESQPRLEPVSTSVATGGRSADRPPAVEVEDLVHLYPGAEHPALKGVSASIDPSEFVWLVGSNGSGKTTMVKHFNGLLKPTTGSVRIQGRDVRDLKAQEVCRLVGHVFQNPTEQLVCDRLLAEVMYGLLSMGLDREAAARKAHESLAQVGLDSRADGFTFNLSKGEQTKLVIASVLAMSPALVVLDEPTHGLDAKTKRDILRIVFEANRGGTSIAFITHDMGLLASKDARVLAMGHGEILADTTARRLFADDALMREASIVPPPIAQAGVSLGIGPVLTGEEALGLLQATGGLATI